MNHLTAAAADRYTTTGPSPARKSGSSHGSPVLPEVEHHTVTGAKTATEITRVQNTMEIVDPAGQGVAGYAQWRERVEWQRAGYVVAGIRSEVNTCGTVAVLNGAAGGQVGVSTSGKGVRVSGMWRCGNRWCAECRAKVAHHKAAEVEQAVRWAFGRGLIVSMYTLTGSHVTAEELDAAEGRLHEAVQGVTAKTVRKRMSAAWRAATTGKRNKALAAGRVGTITAQEVTVDDLMVNGSRSGIHWHRHHMVLLEPQEGRTAQEVAQDHGDLLFDYWQAGAEKVGLTADRKGFDVMVAEDENHAVDLAGYVVKGEHAPAVPAESFAAEVARAEGKNGRGRDRVSPEQVLRNIGYLKAHEPEGKRLRRLFAQWRDLEEGTKGVHWLRWSPGLRDLVGLDAEELSDEEIANTEELDAEEIAVVSWEELREHIEEIRRVVRLSADGEEFATLLVCLDSLGIDYRLESAEEWRERLSARLRAMRSGG